MTLLPLSSSAPIIEPKILQQETYPLKEKAPQQMRGAQPRKIGYHNEVCTNCLWRLLAWI